MAYAKRLADLLTASRVLLAIVFAWLGLVGARDSLALAGFLLLTSWISDLFDGGLARQSGAGPTWIGDHDLEADVTVSLGVLIYLVGAGFLQPNYAVVYILFWVLFFWRWGWQRDPAMLFQAPIYLWLMVVAMQYAPQAGWWLIGYVVLVVVVTWPHISGEVVPDFISGMSKAIKGK
jgi:phosphatidylglycerophosphate synthase